MNYKITHKQILRALSILRDNDFVVSKSSQISGVSRKTLAKYKSDYGDAVFKLIDSSGGWDKVSLNDFNTVTGRTEVVIQEETTDVEILDPETVEIYTEDHYQNLLKTARVEALNKLRRALQNEKSTRTIIEGFAAINEASSSKGADLGGGNDEYLEYFIKGYIKK